MLLQYLRTRMENQGGPGHVNCVFGGAFGLFCRDLTETCCRVPDCLRSPHPVCRGPPSSPPLLLVTYSPPRWGGGWRRLTSFGNGGLLRLVAVADVLGTAASPRPRAWGWTTRSALGHHPRASGGSSGGGRRWVVSGWVKASTEAAATDQPSRNTAPKTVARPDCPASSCPPRSNRRQRSASLASPVHVRSCSLQHALGRGGGGANRTGG